MNIPNVTIKELLEAGVHLGHKTFRWNPKMSKYIFGAKNSIHIIDLVQTLELTTAALQEIYKCVSSGGKVLFVSTKKQAAETISQLAVDTKQFHVTHRWLGGMLTNWKTISNSIKRYKKLTEELQKENTGLTKKEVLKLGIQRDKLERSLGGIADMKKIPDMIFINDVNIEALAVAEAIKLKIPIVAVVDTNSDPTGITFPIPGNDDARRAINLYCDLIKQTILDAQKNITVRVEEEPKSEQINENSNNEKNFKSKVNDKKKKPITEIKTSSAKPKEKKTSLFSKIKSLASNKKK
jgi:small subunit ribosomal protein S2